MLNVVAILQVGAYYWMLKQLKMKPGDENSAIANKKSKKIIKRCTIEYMANSIKLD